MRPQNLGGVVTGLKKRAARRIPAIRRRDQALSENRAQLRKLSRHLNQLRQDLESSTSETADLRRELARSREIARRRKAELARTHEELRKAEKRLNSELRKRRRERFRPSFRSQYHDMRRVAQRAIIIDEAGWHPYRQLKRKLRNYEFVSSHGVRTPAVLSVWSAIESIDLTGLPQALTLKTDFGASGRGVFLRREESSDLVGMNDRRTFSIAEAIQDLSVKAEEGYVEGPFFAEELLLRPDGKPVSTDIKVYVCYGHIAHVLLRSVHLDDPTLPVRARYLNAEGEDLGRVSEVFPIDESIEIPASLDEMMGIARHLSRAAGVPFCRVDLYDTIQGVVFGELTLTPGGSQAYSAAHDTRIGTIWADAQVERDLDLLNGRPFGLLYGGHEVMSLYPPDHVSRSPDPGPWGVRTSECNEWCFGGCEHMRKYEAKDIAPEPPELSSRDQRLRDLQRGPS